MDVVSQPVPAAEVELRLYQDWKRPGDTARVGKALLASAALHIAALMLLPFLPADLTHGRASTEIIARLGAPAKLVEPPRELTQRDPNRGRPSKEFDLEGLLPRPPLQLPAGQPSTTRPAARVLAPPSPPTAGIPVLPDPPAIEGPLTLAQGLPPASQIEPEEKPKLAFEQPRAPAATPGQAGGALKPPGAAISELGREIARGGKTGGMIVGDIGEGVGGLGSGLNLPPSPGRVGSSLELLSDPMGVDFRPYLIQILSSVRRNWFAVMPESAKMGRQGRVVIQFAISRDGNVPKLVIASSSGTQALDRAAVAGISASNPFPPLPSEYRGLSVRLQFVFLYNIR